MSGVHGCHVCCAVPCRFRDNGCGGRRGEPKPLLSWEREVYIHAVTGKAGEKLINVSGYKLVFDRRPEGG